MEKITEAELQHKLIQFLGKWFDVYFEEWADCAKKRIDLLLYHCSDKQRDYPIGIEIKRGEIKRGTDISKWCLQAKSYTQTTFGGKKAHVFTAPQISGWYLEEGKLVNKHNVEDADYLGCQHNVNSFLYRSFGIGELQKFKATYPEKKYEVRLVLNTQSIWQSNNPFKLRTELLDKL